MWISVRVRRVHLGSDHPDCCRANEWGWYQRSVSVDEGTFSFDSLRFRTDPSLTLRPACHATCSGDGRYEIIIDCYAFY